MDNRIKIVNIRNAEQIDKLTNKAVINIKLLTLYGILMFSNEMGLIKSDINKVILSGGLIFGTVLLSSTVKSLCKVYILTEQNGMLDNATKCK